MAGQEDPRGGPRAVPPPAELEGMELRDSSGTSAGLVEDVYVDRQDGTPRYVAVGGGASGQHYLVPVALVRVEDGGGNVAWLVAACEVEQLRGGPTVEQGGTVTGPHEEQVSAYFGGLHDAGQMQPWAAPPQPHGAGYMRPQNEPPEVHGAGYMRPENEPPEVHGAGYMRPENEPPEVHGAGYMRPQDEPPEVGGAGRMDPKFLSAVKRWRE